VSASHRCVHCARCPHQDMQVMLRKLPETPLAQSQQWHLQQFITSALSDVSSSGTSTSDLRSDSDPQCLLITWDLLFIQHIMLLTTFHSLIWAMTVTLDSMFPRSNFQGGIFSQLDSGCYYELWNEIVTPCVSTCTNVLTSIPAQIFYSFIWID